MVDTINLTPTASPTGTYLAPQSIPSTNTALELAKSLGVIKDAATIHIDRKTKQAEEEGRRKGLLHSALTEKEAIEKGIITEFESPWFQKGQYEQRGRLAGDTYDAELTQAYMSSGMQEKTAPDAYEKFVNQFRQDYLNRLDPEISKDSDFLLGLGSKMTQSEQQLSEAHVSNASQKLRYDAVTGTQQEIYNEISKRLSMGPARAEDIVAPVTLVGTRQKTFFLTGKEVNEAKIEAVGQAAIDFNRPDLLDALDQPNPDGTPGPGLTVDGRKKIHEIKQKILGENIRQETYNREKNDRYNKQQADTRMLSAIRKISNKETVTEAEIQDGERFDPDFRLRLIAARKSISSDDEPKDVLGLNKAVHTGQLKTTRDVYDYIATNDVKVSSATIESVITKVEDTQRKVYSDPFVKSQSDILSSTLNPSGLGGIMGDSQAAAEAKARFAERVVSEVSQDITGSQAWRDQIKKIRDEVLKDAEESQKKSIEVRGAKEKQNASTTYFPSLQNLQDVSTLYSQGDTEQLKVILTKAGVPEEPESVTKFLNDQKTLLQKGK